MARGRPPLTRARVLHYIATHRPGTIMQIVRATGADRRHVQRMVRALEQAQGIISPSMNIAACSRRLIADN